MGSLASWTMRLVGRGATPLALCLCATTFAGTARAEASASEKAVAEVLFDEGKQLMVGGDFAQACPKLEQSLRVEEAIGTMLYLGECYEKTGRAASAWAMFREAASRAEAQGQSERAKQGAQRAKQLEGRLSKLTVEVANQNDMEGFEVLLNGKRVEPTLLGLPMPIDTGNHLLEARAPGFVAWSTRVSISGTAVQALIDVPSLEREAEVAAAPPSPPPAAESTPPSEAPPPLDSPPPQELDSSRVQPWLGLGLMGAGVVGVGVGTVFGLQAMGLDDDADDICPRSEECNDQAGLDKTEEAQDNALIANVGYGVGGVLIIAGAILYFTADDELPATARVGTKSRFGAEPIIGTDVGGLRVFGSF